MLSRDTFNKIITFSVGLASDKLVPSSHFMFKSLFMSRLLDVAKQHVGLSQMSYNLALATTPYRLSGSKSTKLCLILELVRGRSVYTEATEVPDTAVI